MEAAIALKESRTEPGKTRHNFNFPEWIPPIREKKQNLRTLRKTKFPAAKSRAFPRRRPSVWQWKKDEAIVRPSLSARSLAPKTLLLYAALRSLGIEEWLQPRL